MFNETAETTETAETAVEHDGTVDYNSPEGVKTFYEHKKAQED